MSNYATAALVTAQAQIATKYNEAELRRKVRPALGLAIKNEEFSIPNAQALHVADQRPVEVHFLNQKSAGSATAKAARHTGTKGDSSKVTLVWNRFVETFSFSRKLMFNKVIGAQKVFNNELEQAILALQDRAETAAISYLYANRCQLASPATSGAGTWDGTNFQLGIASGNSSYFVQQSKTFMRGRNYRGKLDMIVDLIESPVLERVYNQGAGNSTNTTFQFADTNIVYTQDTIFATNTKGQAIVMPEASFAGLVWNDPLNRQTFGEPDDYVGMLTTMQDPFGLGASYDISVYTDRADTSGIDGNIQDIQDQYEVSLTVGWVLPPLATASDSVVHVIAQL